jgi:two-component system phosphate regulon sensor histidine kinase PhoR
VTKRRLFWDLYLSGLLPTLVALVAVAGYLVVKLDRFYLDQVQSDLTARARIMAASLIHTPTPADMEGLCQHLGRLVSTRLTVIDPAGRVLADSDRDPASMESHAGRAEVDAALSGTVGVATRFSTTIRTRTMYVAVPMVRDGVVIGVVRAALPVTATDALVSVLNSRVALGAAAAALGVALLSIWTARRISRPLEQLRATAERFAAGDLHARAPGAVWIEMSSLASALNGMASSLDERMRTVMQQRNELQAVLSGMAEGVLAVDGDERVMSFNAAAARVFGLDLARDRGRSLYEVIRSPDVQRLALSVLQAGQPVEADVEFDMGEARFLRVRGSALVDAGGQRVGAILVFEDETTVRRLELVRREFVANASHELKTPITAIKGYVETLTDGACDDPVQAKRFLEIVARQADRLESIINDMLVLSRVEHEKDSGVIAMQTVPLADLVQGSVQACSGAAEAKGMSIRIECPAGISVTGNPRLLEQALTNLIDNAIKYSGPGKPVAVSGARCADGICLAVVDQGCGIAREHLDRVFERFYQVDKARSQDLGGTGLGLSIVKHIVALHKGRITVESTPGKGSTFTVVLPC